MTDRLDDSHPDLDERPPDADALGDWFDRVLEAPEEDAVDDRDGSVGGGPVGGDEVVAPPTPSERATRRVLDVVTFRRLRDWAERPWPTERVVKYVVTVLSLTATTYVMMNVVHLSPFAGRDLVFDDTTPTGGDFGAHVWGPAYLRDHLLGDLRFNGWTMDWYSGMPAYRFYMVLPALAIVAIDVVLPYGVAMKLVSVLGLITFPAACWAFGRLASFRYPVPELFAFAGLAFVLDESFSIYGGNLKSTMAGEFSFSIALSLGMVALGVLAAGLRTGKYRVWASVLIAAACVSHGIVLLFVAGAALIFSLVWIDRTRLYYSVTVGITSVLLLMWWAGPFLLDHDYMTDMKYGPRPSGAEDSFWDMFFPLTAPLDFAITTLAVIGFLVSILRRNLNGVALGIVGLVFVVGVYLARDSLPVIGLLWNPRLLPFVYLVRYLLMVIGAVVLLGLAWNAVRDRRALALPNVWEGSAFAAVVALSVSAVLAFMFQVLPFAGYEQAADGTTVYAWGPIKATTTNTDAQGDGWARYNFLGYEGRDQYYTEYHQVVTTMQDIGNDPQLGCGRALWENNSDNGLYGTTMALMLLPHWTDGCIGSMEGLFFEASGTTPYHFLAAAAMSKQSSNPVRELRYVDNDASVGVGHLQDLGVRYVMVRTPEAKAEAAAEPELRFIVSSAPWDIYLVEGSDIVVPLDVQPVVVHDRPGDGRERNLELGTSWFQQRDEWTAMPADDGPAEWQRISVQADPARREGTPGEPGRRVDIVTPVETIEAVPLPAATVSDVEIGEQSVSFSVDQVGVPVLVKVSYFPNWEVSGATGPYRAGPNMMVVVPDDTSVELTYGRSMVDYVTMLLTLVGIGLCVWWRIQGDVEHAGEVPASFLAPVVSAPPGLDDVGSSDRDVGEHPAGAPDDRPPDEVPLDEPAFGSSDDRTLDEAARERVPPPSTASNGPDVSDPTWSEPPPASR